MRSRLIPIVLALAAASAFAFAMQTAWWTAGEVSIGPFGSRHCFGGECRETGLAWLGGSELWLRAAVAVRAAGYISMFILVVVAGGLASGRIPRLMARASLVAILTAIASGGYFALKFPGGLSGTESVGLGLILFIGAIVVGIAAAVITLRMPDPKRA